MDSEHVAIARTLLTKNWRITAEVFKAVQAAHKDWSEEEIALATMRHFLDAGNNEVISRIVSEMAALIASRSLPQELKVKTTRARAHRLMI